MADGKQVCNTDNVYINQVYACFYWFLYPNVLMVDKSIEPKDGNVVIAAINGEITVKRLSVVDSKMTLTADKPNYHDVKFGDFDESII